MIRLEFSSNIFWMFAGFAGGLPAPPGPLVVEGPAAGPLGPGGPDDENCEFFKAHDHEKISCHQEASPHHQACFLQQRLEVGWLGHQREQGLTLAEGHSDQEDLSYKYTASLSADLALVPGGAPDTEGCIAVDILSETKRQTFKMYINVKFLKLSQPVTEKILSQEGILFSQFRQAPRICRM